MDIWFFLSGVKRRIAGKNHFEKGKAFIVVCNHNSFMDVPLSSTCLPGPNKTIAKIEMTKIPVFGMVYKRGSVLVDRKSDASRKQSFNKMKEVLAMGLHMCIYPEGTRNKGKEPLQKFYDGAFRLSVETKAPIIPCLIFNTAKVLPRNKAFYFHPQPVAMHFLEPISPEGLKVEELRERVFSVMEEHYRMHR